ncbi:VRR-NUC domain-containing protein [Burkholderia sp. BCC0419]|uniref:VRR-NUC domain-containing protein n=1 Tax=Burkholderia sp. BCC0419 TaxID=486878 RepID=UPI00158AE2A6|nr:VRR-NUC domain-containing protein [Burkholderia sp. BCC0419]
MAEPTYRTIGNSRTLPTPRGKTIPVLPPDDTGYLCQRVCRCDCNPIISSRGRKFKQRCVTVSIRNDCDSKEQVWKYKGEVGYNMVNNPPSPIMASLRKNQPLQFPLGVDTKALEGAIDLAKLTGRAQKGLLRIPDVVIVKNMHDFDLSQCNIEFVVEIKFPGDRWQRDQQRDYEFIAGDADRLKLLSPSQCACKTCEEPESVPKTVTLPEKLVAPDFSRRLSNIRWHNNEVARGVSPGPQYLEPTTLADVLKTGATIIGGLAVAYVVVATGPPLLVLLAVGGGAAAAAQ